MATDLRARAVGAYGERVAVRFLIQAGMVVLERNWRCAHGEVDIVAKDGDCLVICEVKTRRSTDFGTAVEQVTARKAARLRILAGAWLSAHPQQARGIADVRIDVVGVSRARRGPAQVEHLIGVS